VNRNAGLTAGIVALLALMARVAGSGGHGQGSADQAESGGKAKQGQAQEAGGTPRSYEGPWMATRHFFAPYQPPPLSVTDPRSQIVDFKNPDDILRCSADTNCLSELHRFFGLTSPGGVECLLAIVPDPFHTRLALFTDHTIEAIRKGAGAADWEFATQWLPWNDTVDPAEGDPDKMAQERRDIREREKQPGVLVFRHADWGQRALLVFLVGETPTAGVNPDQFQIARAYMRALCDPNKHKDNVRIDGPTFSGSFYSLASLILQDKDKQPRQTYQVQSGTAQSQDAARDFEERTWPEVEFHSAIENLGDQDRHFHDVLNRLRIPPDRAAVLAEDDSTFGRAASHQDSAGPVRVFRFPRDISHLRDAYRQALQVSKSDKAPVPSLDFSLKDPSVGEDTVPTYSSTQTPLSQNSVINEITRTIRRDDIRMVEVSATNVLDLLFLAGVLRRQCPDTRLLIQFADLLFVQGEQTQPLDGTLFLTSYPLFAESKLWEERRDGRKEIAIFPDTLSEGVFNATVLLLATGDRRKTALADYAWPSIPHPPAWLLTLDRRGFTPVRVWPQGAAKGWFQPVWGMKGKLDLLKVASPRFLNLLSSVFALFSIGIGAWILRLCRNEEWMVDARFEPPEAEDSWRGFYILLFLLILVGIQIAIFVARPFVDDWPRLMLLLAGCGLPAWIAVRYCRPGRKRGLAMWLAAGTVLAGVGLWSFCCLGEGSWGQLFSFRAADLRFGSSPLWPIVAAAAALLLWCFVHVTRLYFVSCGQPEVVTDGVEVLKGRLKASYDEFTNSARSALGLSAKDRFWFPIALAAFAALCCLSRVDVQLGSIDGAPYDFLCIALQLLVVGLLLLTCWHIRVFWKSLHCFTTNLGLLPLARAFIQVSPSGGNRPIWVRRCNLQSLEIHTNAMLILHDMGLQLQREQLPEHGRSQARLIWWQRLYRSRINSLLTVDPITRQELAHRHRRLWCLSKLVASQMWQPILKPAWESEPLIGKLDYAPSSKPADQAAHGQDTVAPIREQPLNIHGDPQKVADLAETFVALHYSPFLMYGVRQIQNLLWFPSIGFALLMLSMNSYNFQAPHLIGRLLLILFAAIAWMLGTCMAQIERDPILSRIAGTKPGALNATFYLKLARYAALPILGLLASQFPSISNLLFSWIEPALEALQ